MWELIKELIATICMMIFVSALVAMFLFS